MNKKEGKMTLLAVVLVCLMVSGSFIGLLDSAYKLTSEYKQNTVLVDERAALTSLDDIPLRMSTDFVYDSESDKAIFFGGATENLHADYEDTWSYDFNTNTWTNMSPSVNPPASDFNQMVYHSGEDKVVLFGGHVSGAADDWLNHNETWTYNYNTNTWTDMDPVVAPPAIAGGCMAYDSESNLIVLFAGSTNDWVDDGMISETWTYDLVTNTWVNVTTSSQPSPRSWSSLAYDIESDYIVLHGGWTTNGPGWSILNDTWIYDTNTNTWTELSVVGPTILGDLAYDSESDLMVFWGGTADMDELIEDLRSETWTYDTNTETWEQMVNEVKPPVRSRGELVYDSESDKILLFGGVLDGGWDSEEVVHDCWSYDLNNNLWNNVDWDWQEMTPLFSPEPTAYPAMTYDSESDIVVMFGGETEEQFQATGLWGDNETWTYDYNTNEWVNMSPSVAPSMRCLTDMVYDEESDIIILFGGVRHNTEDTFFLGDTWAYDVNTNIWTNMSPVVSPGPRFGQCMTYDSKSDRIVLFSGLNGTFQNSEETWTYDYNTNTWTLMNPTVHPHPRNVGAMAYDEESELSILFGGYIMQSPYELDDTWVYNSTADTWTEMSPTEHPSIRSELKAVYDSSADRVVMFGGWAYDVVFDETWTYDYNNNNWTEMNSPNSPSERYWYGLAFDSESNRTILYSGDHALYNGIDIQDADTWAYRYQINPPSLLPGPPRNLEVLAENNGLPLTWEAPLPLPGVTVIGYNVYRGSEFAEYELVAELGNVLTYIDKTAGYGIGYYYAVTAVSAGGEGPFSNSPAGSRAFVPFDDEVYSFIAYGDSRASDETAVASIHDDLVSHYLQHDPEMIIHSGDLVNHGGEAYQWPLFNDSIAAIYEWDAEMKFYAAAGNHEKYTDVYGVNDEDYSTYRDFFDFSDVADGESETELYFSFDWHGIHFVIINTAEEWDSSEYTCPTEQWTWLENDLAGDHTFTVVFTHYPFYSILEGRSDRLEEAESIRNTFHNLFNETGVDIVFTGHNHYYHRTVRDNIQYITVAGGGAPLYGIDKVQTDWQEGDVGFSELHYCVASIVDNVLEIEVVLLDGSIADAFNISMFEHPASDGQVILILIIVGGVALVAIVIVLYFRKKK